MSVFHNDADPFDFLSRADDLCERVPACPECRFVVRRHDGADRPRSLPVDGRDKIFSNLEDSDEQRRSVTGRFAQAGSSSARSWPWRRWRDGPWTRLDQTSQMPRLACELLLALAASTWSAIPSSAPRRGRDLDGALLEHVCRRKQICCGPL